MSNLRADVRFITSTTSSEYSDTDVDRNLNRWYRVAQNWIEENSGPWQYDDSNATDLPIATATLVDGQADYELPSTARKVEGIDVKDNEGNWHKLGQVDESEMPSAIDERHKTDGLPVEYRLVGRSIIVKPSPASGDVTLSNGLKVYFSREVTALSATSDEPGFAESFHRILSLGAAIDWCIAYGDDKKEVDLRRQLFGGQTTDGLRRQLIKFYGSRNKGKRARIEHKPENYS